jgi:hypothetical protein
MSILLAAVLSFAPVDGPVDGPADAAAPAAGANNQDADAAALVGEDDAGRHYIFDGDSLTGDVLTPEGQLIPWHRPTKHSSLITIRPHFMRELLQLARDL